MAVQLTRETVLVPGRRMDLPVSVPRKGLVVSCHPDIEIWPKILEPGDHLVLSIPRTGGTLGVGTQIAQVLPIPKTRKGAER